MLSKAPPPSIYWTYPPVVVSARPSEVLGVVGAWAGGTVEVVSALAMVTSLALPASSPQCGQKLWPLSTEAQARWKRWEMLLSGWHSMKVPWGWRRKVMRRLKRRAETERLQIRFSFGAALKSNLSAFKWVLIAFAFKAVYALLKHVITI